jgi:uncharacterized protein (DUF1330 family)
MPGLLYCRLGCARPGRNARIPGSRAEDADEVWRTYIVRGGKFEIVEGNWQPPRVVMLEFPSMEQAKLWYQCEEYKEMKAARFKAATTDVVLVGGA